MVIYKCERFENQELMSYSNQIIAFIVHLDAIVMKALFIVLLLGKTKLTLCNKITNTSV